MRVLMIFLVSLLATPAFAKVYSCALGFGTDIGTIRISGDPYRHVYKGVVIAGAAKIVKQVEEINPHKLFLYDLRTFANSYGLEIENYSENPRKFPISVYTKDHIFGGLRRLAFYDCVRSQSQD